MCQLHSTVHSVMHFVVSCILIVDNLLAAYSCASHWLVMGQSVVGSQ